LNATSFTNFDYDQITQDLREAYDVIFADLITPVELEHLHMTLSIINSNVDENEHHNRRLSAKVGYEEIVYRVKIWCSSTSVMTDIYDEMLALEVNPAKLYG
jgi:hypothetical protein